ncbi:helix-turn-helix transcriptional regulator [Hyphomicrobium zavarzinii]|jgi:excisionase family DNA binding protein|uniref:helix-turn-helix transcriptional regulator n=1 Tax=Hyphomicrobium zavarzinii TaxID=48292 RepID=UPI000A009D71|nr:helix-turn-helix domain-containing protein [Hyphomicrobium zavarzinii]
MKRDSDFEFVFLTTEEAAELLRLSRRTLEAKRRNGKGPPFTRMGDDQNSKVVYRLDSLLDWSARMTHVKVVPKPRRHADDLGDQDDWIGAFLAYN